MIKYILIRIVTFYFLLISSGLADDAVFFGDGASVFPIKSVDIQMVSESIRMKYAGNLGWMVEVEEKFKNHGPAINVQIGFPFDTYEEFDIPDDYTGKTDDIKPEYDPQFKTYINGDSVEVVSKFGLKNPEIDFHYKWVYTFTTYFSENETKIIRHTYTVGGERDALGGSLFRYILKTGSLWRGNIEEISVEMAFDKSDAVNFNCVSPKEHSATERDGEIILSWRFKNIKPDFDIKIESFSDLPNSRAYENINNLINAILDPYIEGKLPDSRCRFRYLRNLIFASYGYPFKNPFIRAHFYKSKLHGGPKGNYYKELKEDNNFNIANISEKHRELLDRLNKPEKDTFEQNYGIGLIKSPFADGGVLKFYQNPTELKPHRTVEFKDDGLAIALIAGSCGIYYLQENEMKALRFSHNHLKSRVSYEQASKFQPLQGLKLEVADSVNIDSGKISLKCTLINTTAKSVPVVIFPVGGVNPFHIKFLPDQKVRAKPHHGPPLPQQVPPPPMELIVPALTKMEFSSEINLQNFEYEGTPTIKVEWSFHYWQNPMKGVLLVVLPPSDNIILKN